MSVLKGAMAEMHSIQCMHTWSDLAVVSNVLGASVTLAQLSVVVLKASDLH